MDYNFLTSQSAGNITAIPIILIVTLTLTISVLTSYLVLDEIIGSTTNDEIRQEPLQDAKSALEIFDLGIVFVNASFYIASFIFVYQIRSNPIYVIPSFLFLTIAVWFSAEVANVYSYFANTGPFTSVVNNFTALHAFYNELALITAVLGFGIIVLLYGKTRSGTEVTV